MTEIWLRCYRDAGSEASNWTRTSSSSNKQNSKYCGHIFTSEGILPDPAKVEAITQMPRPRSKTEGRRLLGMINYLGKFLPQLSDVSEPLTNLTKAQNQFIWSKVQQDAFNKLTRL